MRTNGSGLYGILYRMNTIQIGRIGEAAIVSEFVQREYDIYMPIFGNADFDLIVAKDKQLYRVEVKSTSYERYPGKYEVQLKSVRHNTSETKIKKFDGTKSDLLAIYIIPTGTVVILDSMDYHDRCTTLIEGTAQGANRS